MEAVSSRQELGTRAPFLVVVVPTVVVPSGHRL